MGRDIFYSKDGNVSAVMCGWNGGKVIFNVRYNGGVSAYETHEIKLYAWARGLHGNAPSGTPYGYFRASRNGKRVIITV